MSRERMLVLVDGKDINPNYVNDRSVPGLCVPMSRLPDIVKALPYTQRDIAARAGLHQTTVSNTVRGKVASPNPNVLDTIKEMVTDIIAETADHVVKTSGEPTCPADISLQKHVSWRYRATFNAIAKSIVHEAEKPVGERIIAGWGEDPSRPETTYLWWVQKTLPAGAPAGQDTNAILDFINSLLNQGGANPYRQGNLVMELLVQEVLFQQLLTGGNTATVITQGFEEELEEEEEEEEAPAVVVPEDFDLDAAYKVANVVRGMQRERMAVTFSLRKLIVWGQAYALLRDRLGYDHREALGASFEMVATGKTTGETRIALISAFNGQFGFNPEIPKPPQDGTTTHPMEYIARPFVEAGMPIWLWGETGCGKTHSALNMAKELGRPVYRVQGTGDMTVDDLLGGWSAKDGTTYKEPGPLPLAMGINDEPGTLVFDEASACPAEVLFEMHAVLEGNPLMIKKFRGMIVKPDPIFGVVCCDNSVGQAEANMYVGTNMMNEAFRDRFLFLQYDYMPQDRELQAVKQHIDTFKAKWISPKEEEVRQAVTPGQFTLSPDALERIKRSLKRGGASFE